MCLAANQRPTLEGTPVACLPVRIFGFQGETGIDDDVQTGFILKADVNGMVLASGEDLDKIDGLAFDLFKAVKSASTVTADRGLTALGFSKAE